MLETALSGLGNAISWKVLVGFSPNLHQWCIMGQMNGFNFGGQKVKVQDHSGIASAGTVTTQAEAYSTRRIVSS